MTMEEKRSGTSAPRLWQPSTPREAWELKSQWGERACYVSGGTLLRTQWENGVRSMPDHLISLDNLTEMRGIRFEGIPGKLTIGALESLQELRQHAVLGIHAPILLQAAACIAAPSVRQLATIGGNIASLSGDAVTALLALEAILYICKGDERMLEIPLGEWIAGANGVRHVDDLIVGVAIPVREMKESDFLLPFGFFEKLGRREAFTPSLVTVAATGSVDREGRLEGVRLTAGGGTALPHRLDEAEEALNGQRLSSTTLTQVHELIKTRYAAAGDAFAGSAYRKEVSANLIAAQLWKLRR